MKFPDQRDNGQRGGAKPRDDGAGDLGLAEQSPDLAQTLGRPDVVNVVRFSNNIDNYLAKLAPTSGQNRKRIDTVLT